MELLRTLLAPPAIELTMCEPAPDGPEFLGMARVLARCRYPHGETSEPFRYDIVTRAALDAVVVVPTFVDAAGERYVVLRSAPRVPLALRDPALGNLWELPAGLIEPGETVAEAGARELGEEIGASVAPDSLLPLGPPVAPAPGALAEIQHFLRAEIDPARCEVPREDGSPLERHAKLAAIPVALALAALGRLGLVDAKTELALRRLAEVT